MTKRSMGDGDWRTHPDVDAPFTGFKGGDRHHALSRLDHTAREYTHFFCFQAISRDRDGAFTLIDRKSVV